MDVVTHVLAAVVLGIATRQRVPEPLRAAWVPVAGAAALAPDLDVFLTPLALWEPLYWLSHRSASHSIVGAPVAAFLIVALLSAWGRRWSRLALFRWQRGLWPAVLMGAWSHLPLDMVTIKGVPLWWPVTDAFVSIDLFFWIVPWLAPISFVVLLQRYRGRWDDRRLVQGAAVVAVIIVVLAGVRIATRPEGETYPTAVPWQWTLVEEHPNGTWQVTEGGDMAWYPVERPSDAEGAIGDARASRTFRAFRFDSVGPIAVSAARGDGGWWVNGTAVLEDFSLRDVPGWLPVERMRERARVAVFVHD